MGVARFSGTAEQILQGTDAIVRVDSVLEPNSLLRAVGCLLDLGWIWNPGRRGLDVPAPPQITDPPT